MEDRPIKKIGIMGKMGSGKTTLANKIIELDSRFIRISFADKIKEIARELFSMRHKDRQLLQDIGSKMREIRSSVWIDYVIGTIIKKGYTHIVIDDVRFEDEIQALKRCGFHLVYLDIDEEARIQRLQKRDADFTLETYHGHSKHQSEQVDQYLEHADVKINVEAYPTTEEIIRKYFPSNCFLK